MIVVQYPRENLFDERLYALPRSTEQQLQKEIERFWTLESLKDIILLKGLFNPFHFQFYGKTRNASCHWI
jgi:hypothetical protein